MDKYLKSALHDMTIAAMIDPMTQALDRLLEEGSVKSNLDVDAETLAGILLKGSEALIHSLKFDKGEIQRMEIQRMEILRNSLSDFWKLIIEF